MVKTVGWIAEMMYFMIMYSLLKILFINVYNNW